MKRRIWSVLIVLIMAMTSVGVPAFAEEAGTEVTGEECSQQMVEEMSFLYVESRELETPGVENIAVAWDETVTEAENLRLLYEGEDGLVREVEAASRTETAVLFSIFFEQADAGEYRLLGIAYEAGGEPQMMGLDEVNIDPVFRVVAPEETMIDALDEAAEEDGAMGLMSEEAKEKAAMGKTVKVVLDPGHGGSENGAYYGGIKEKYINMKIAKACKSELEKYAGIKVYMTRTKDETVSLDTRAKRASKYDPDILISIHNNAVDKEGTGGCEVWYPNTYGPDAYGVTGKALGKDILNELVYLGLYNRGTKVRTGRRGHDYYGIIRCSKARGFPAIIIEHAFLDNAAERAKYLSDDASLKQLGVSDATGIAAYYGLKRFKFNASGAVIDQDGNLVENRWVRVDGKYYHTDSAGIPLTGFQKIDGQKYYLSKTGAKMGWMEIEGNRYYRFNDRGRLSRNTIRKIGNYNYAFDNDGVMYRDTTVIIKDKKYLIAENGMVVIHTAKIKQSLNARAEPRKGAVSKEILKRGSTVQVVRTYGGWSRLANGHWFVSKYKKNISKYPKYVPYKIKTTTSLNYRKGPGTKYSKRGTFPRGHILTIVYWKNGWGKTKGGNWIYLTYTQRIN